MNFTTIWDFIVTHRLEVWAICAVAINSLPAPQVNSSQFYQFIWKFLTTLAANPVRAFSSLTPVPMAQKKSAALPPMP